MRFGQLAQSIAITARINSVLDELSNGNQWVVIDSAAHQQLVHPRVVEFKLVGYVVVAILVNISLNSFRQDERPRLDVSDSESCPRRCDFLLDCFTELHHRMVDDVVLALPSEYNRR